SYAGPGHAFRCKPRRVDRRVCRARRAVRGSARLPEYSRHRDYRHTGRLNGTAGPRVRTQSLAGDHRARTLRRESFRFVLFRGPADWLTCSTQLSCYISSAIQQARIELIIDWRRDTDLLEIRMLRIEQEICVRRANYTR